MIIEVRTDINSPSGYSKHARSVVRAMVETGLEVQIDHLKCDRNTIAMEGWWENRIQDLVKPKGEPTHTLQILTPDLYQLHPTAVNIGYTAWETSRLPGPFPGWPAQKDWVHQMNQMHEIWTPASFAVDVFRDSGVTRPAIRYMPLPVDQDHVEGELQIIHATHDGLRRPIPKNRRPLIFGSMGQWIHRKNLDDLVTTFVTAFEGQEAVLVLKTYGAYHGHPDEEKRIRERASILSEGVKKDKPPHVVLIQESLSETDIAKFFNTIDVYVTFSRGEGFCIPAATAMAAGVPVVATGWSSFTDYIEDGETGWLVDYRMEPVCGMPGSPWYRHDQQWASIDPNDAISIFHSLRDARVQGRWEKVLEVSREGRERILGRFSTALIGSCISEALAQAAERSSIAA